MNSPLGFLLLSSEGDHGSYGSECLLCHSSGRSVLLLLLAGEDCSHLSHKEMDDGVMTLLN